MRVYAKIDGRPYFLQKIPAPTFKGLQSSSFNFIALGYDQDTGLYTVVSPVEIKKALKDTYTTNDDDLKPFTQGEGTSAATSKSIPPVFDPDARSYTVVSPVETRKTPGTHDGDLEPFTPGEDIFVPPSSRSIPPVFDLLEDFNEKPVEASEADTQDVDPPVSRPSLEPRIIPPGGREPG
jgi:hypothetical protein